MYVIIGASGFFGPHLIKNILGRNTKKIIATYNSKPAKIDDEKILWKRLDLSDFNAIKKFCEELRNEKYAIKLIYLSAISSPDQVEKNPTLSWNINVTALSIIINEIPKLKTFYFASTDSVYGESFNDHIFKEDDALTPINTYAKHKALGEAIVLSRGYNVLRYPLMAGNSMCDKKHLYDTALDNLAHSKKIEMFADSYRNCLSFNQAANLTINLIEKYPNGEAGIVNIGSDNAISRYELGLFIAEKFSYDKSLVIPVLSDNENQIFLSKRANKTLMNNNKLKKLLGLDKIGIVF